jgi:hypothetical protein
MTDIDALIHWLNGDESVHLVAAHALPEAASALAEQREEIARLTANYDYIASRYQDLVIQDEEHCKDCCCARSWKALGITEYTGKSIPEHIEALRARVADYEDDYNAVANEQCAPDEKHCTCVAPMRQVIRGLRARVAELEAEHGKAKE